VLVIQARSAGLNTRETQVIVTVLTDAAVIVFVGNRSTALVAVDTEDAGGRRVGDDWGGEVVGNELPIGRRRIAPMRGVGSIDHGLIGGKGRAQDGLEIVAPFRGDEGFRKLFGLGGGRLFIQLDDSNPKLQLGLGSAIELFVDSGVVGVETDVTAGAVGVAFKDDVNICGNAKKLAELRTLVRWNDVWDVRIRRDGE
jgi:hypothetical protein